MRRKWGCKLQITFLGVDQLFPNSLLVVTQPSFSSSCPERETLVVPIHSQRPPCHLLLREKTFFFVSYLILKGLLCWPQSDDFPNGGFISTPLPFIFFHSRIPPALILQGFSVPLMPCSVGLDSFPSTNTEPAKKLQATDLTLWNLLCLMLLYFIIFFFCKGDCWRLFVSCFSYNIFELKCCRSNIFKQQEAFYFQGFRWSILSSLNHIHKGFSISSVWHFMLSTAVVRTISETRDLSHHWVVMTNLEKQIFVEDVKRPGR